MINYFKALGDKTRIRILNLLLDNELNVNEIMSVLSMGQSRISRHLKILSDCKLLTSRRDGLWVFYKTAENGEGREFLQSILPFIKNEETLKPDLLKIQEIRKMTKLETSRFFDSVAQDWEQLKMDIFGDFKLDDLILDYMDNCSIAADLGCGTGDFLPVLKRKSLKVIGVDNSPNMLNSASNRFLDDGSYDLRLGEMEHLPLKNEEVDFVLVNMVLHHLSSPYDGISEANRVLKIGKKIIVVEFIKHDDETMRKKYNDRWLGFDEKQIADWLAEAGFLVNIVEKYELKRGLKVSLYMCTKESLGSG